MRRVTGPDERLRRLDSARACYALSAESRKQKKSPPSVAERAFLFLFQQSGEILKDCQTASSGHAAQCGLRSFSVSRR